jgi:hypothetical protein
VYEKGIALFDYPAVLPIWLTYLQAFITRFGGKKVERVRDMFEQAVDGAPADAGRQLYLMYARYEEEFGLERRVGSATALVKFSCVLCTLRTQISRSIRNFTHDINIDYKT